MLQSVFAIYDSKAEAYEQPFFRQNSQVAIREFASACNESESKLNRWPGDYTLFHVADFDPWTGRFIPLDAFNNLGTALQYVRAQEPLGEPRAAAK